MKKCYAFLSALMFLISIGFAEENFRTFTASDGRTLSARILDFSTSSGKIRIERQNGKTLWVLPTVFSEEDQEYIHRWIAADQFMSPVSVIITGTSKRGKTTHKYVEIHGEKAKSADILEIEYEITLENRTDRPLTDICIEYRAFILNRGYDGCEDTERVGGGQLEIPVIPANERITVTPEPVALTTCFQVKGIYYDNGFAGTSINKMSHEELEGFWVKVYGPSLDGERRIREWCYPEDTNVDYTWQEITPSLPKTASTPPRELTREERELIKQGDEFRRTDPEKAIEFYTKAYEIAQHPEVAAGLGSIYMNYLKPWDIPMAIEWYKKAADADHPIAYSATTTLAELYGSYRFPDYRDVDMALEYALKAVKLRPEFGSSHRTLAAIYSEAGDFTKAITHQRLAIKYYGDAPVRSQKKRERLMRSLESEMALYQQGISRYANS